MKHVPGDKAVLDLAQNRLGTLDGKLNGSPMLVYGLDHPEVRWLLMPINLGLTPSRESLGINFEAEDQPEQNVQETSAPPRAHRRKPAVTEPATAAVPPSPVKRNAEHLWPEIGIVLEGEYRGQIFSAVIANAPSLKSGRAIQVTSGPAAGHTFHSMTGAMDAATYALRAEFGSGKSKKGLPSSGWEFWKPARRRRATG